MPVVTAEGSSILPVVWSGLVNHSMTVFGGKLSGWGRKLVRSAVCIGQATLAFDAERAIWLEGLFGLLQHIVAAVTENAELNKALSVE